MSALEEFWIRARRGLAGAPERTPDMPVVCERFRLVYRE